MMVVVVGQHEEEIDVIHRCGGSGTQSETYESISNSSGRLYLD